jgi:hypothetical protein
VIRAIVLLVVLWLACFGMLMAYADGLYLPEKKDRDEAATRAMKFASVVTAIAALLWWICSLPPSHEP